MTPRTCLVGLFVALVAAQMPTRAMAGAPGPSEADKVEARKHFDQGRRLFDLRHYLESVPEFETAYRLSGDPALLYNIAQSYRLADHPDEAIHYYNTFLRRDPDTAKRAEVERRLKELQSTKAPPNQVTEPTGRAPVGEPPPAQSASAAPPPSDVGRVPRQGQGLFASTELGVGFVSAGSEEADVQLSSVGALFSLRAGYFVVPRLALFGQISSAGATNPTINGGGNSGTASGTLAFTGLGAGLLYYIPSRWFGAASIIFQRLSWDGSGASVPNTVGAALSLSVGRDWELSERFSFGVVGQMHLGGVSDDAASGGDWTTVALCIGGIITYD